MISRGCTAYQTSYHLLCQMLHGALRDAMQSARSAEVGVGSMTCRAIAVLYGLLLDHPVDRRGRCRSCRRPGEVFGLRRRRCRIHRQAHFYFHHPDNALLLGHLTREVGLPTPVIPGVDAELELSGPSPGIGNGRGVDAVVVGSRPLLPTAISHELGCGVGAVVCGMSQGRDVALPIPASRAASEVGHSEDATEQDPGAVR